MKGSMSGENPPVWAQKLLKQFADVKELFEQKFNALNERKDSWALINRVVNVERRTGNLEDLQDTHTKTIRDLSN